MTVNEREKGTKRTIGFHGKQKAILYDQFGKKVSANTGVVVTTKDLRDESHHPEPREDDR